MIRAKRRWLAGFAAALSLFPGTLRAQAAAPWDTQQEILSGGAIVVPIGAERQEAAGEFAGSPALASIQNAPQAANGRRMTRTGKIAIGAASGALVGALVAAPVLGPGMDMAPGQVLLLATVPSGVAGALIAWVLTQDDPGSARSTSSVSVAPVMSLTGKALVVTLALK